MGKSDLVRGKKVIFARAHHPPAIQWKLTIAESKQTKVDAAKDTRVDTVQLCIDHSLQLRVARRSQAVRRRGYNPVDVDRVARVLAVCDRVGNERVSVGDTRGLRKVNHCVRVVLLCAGIRVGEEGIYAVDAGQLDAGVVRQDVSAANQLQGSE